jgi:hypothetical protein
MTREVASAPADEQRIKEQDQEQQDEDIEVDADHEVDDLEDSKPKKKRRVVKISDKKYECPHPECGKAYSRAEHLYRHQLNRTYHIDIITRVMSSQVLTLLQTRRSRSIIATFQDATAALSAQTSALDTRNAIQLKGLIYSEKTRFSTARGPLGYLVPLHPLAQRL